MTDPIHDAVERIRRIMSENGMLSPKIEADLADAEDALRDEWGGDRPYIARNGLADRERVGHLLSERNRSIIREWKNGERICFLSRKYGVTKQRIWKIING